MSKNLENLAVVFDCDGTLVDSMGRFADIASDVIARHFGRDREWGRARYRETSGLPFSYQLEEIFPGSAKIPTAVNEYDKKKWESYAKAPFFPDVFPALEWLVSKGAKIAVSSNNDASLLREKMEPIARWLGCVAGFKPGFLKGRAHFKWIQKSLGRTKMIFVGDSLHDAVMAQESHLPFYARVGTFTEDDFRRQGIAGAVLKDFFALENLLPE